MIHNFINKNKYFNDENLKNVLHIVFSNYDSNTTTIDGLNSHIETVVNTIYNDKNVDDLYDALQTMQNKSFTHEHLKKIDNSNRIILKGIDDISKNAKKTFEDKVSSLKKEETDATTVPVTVTTTKMKTALTDKAKKTLEDKVSSLKKEETDATTVPVNVDTNEMKTALTDKAKEILETKIKEALNKPAIMVTDVDENRIKEDLTDKAKETVDIIVTEEMKNYLSNITNYMEEIDICIKFPRKRFGIENPGTQCYSNAIFQMLYSMPTMRKIFTSINIDDENDTIGLFVNRFKNINTNPSIKQQYSPQDTCLSRYYTPDIIYDREGNATIVTYKNHVGAEDFFLKGFLPSISLRIFKYILILHDIDPNEIDTFTHLNGLKDSKAYKTINESIIRKLEKLYNITENVVIKEPTTTTRIELKFTDKGFYIADVFEHFYTKYISHTIVEDEKKIVFNNKENSKIINNINSLFEFVDSFTITYDNYYLCEKEEKGEMNDKTTNKESQYVLGKSEILTTCQLEIADKEDDNDIKTIQNAINAMSKDEEIDGTLTSTHCPDGKTETKRVYRYNIPILNKYLIISLKRWADGNKITNIVEPTQKIKINNSVEYTLTGVICHSGDVNTGHYFYYEYDHNGYIQYCYNDAIVNELEEGEFVKQEEFVKQKEKYPNITQEEFVEQQAEERRYTNKKAATHYIKKNGYIFLYSRYPVDQYTPLNTQDKLIAKNEELETDAEEETKYIENIKTGNNLGYSDTQHNNSIVNEIKNEINTNLINIAKKDFEDRVISIFNEKDKEAERKKQLSKKGYRDDNEIIDENLKNLTIDDLNEILKQKENALVKIIEFSKNDYNNTSQRFDKSINKLNNDITHIKELIQYKGEKENNIQGTAPKPVVVSNRRPKPKRNVTFKNN